MKKVKTEGGEKKGERKKSETDRKKARRKRGENGEKVERERGGGGEETGRTAHNASSPPSSDDRVLRNEHRSPRETSTCMFIKYTFESKQQEKQYVKSKPNAC